jgi:hypothetical protein
VSSLGIECGRPWLRLRLLRLGQRHCCAGCGVCRYRPR